MNKYYIFTDSVSREVQAKTLKEALNKWGHAPATVTTAERFEAWLEKCGGYGGIQENGLWIVNVRQ